MVRDKANLARMERCCRSRNFLRMFSRLIASEGGRFLGLQVRGKWRWPREQSRKAIVGDEAVENTWMLEGSSLITENGPTRAPSTFGVQRGDFRDVRGHRCNTSGRS